MRIEDLGNPVHTQAALDVMKMAEGVNVTLTADAILEAARSQTGLSDFGAMDFVERLAVMCRSADEDAMNAMGRMMFYNQIVGYAANRLRPADLLR